MIFPEGGRTADGWAQEFSAAAAAYLALRTGSPVVPVYLHGTRRILPKRDEAAPRRLGHREQGSRLRRARGRRSSSDPPLRAGEGENARRFGARIERAVELLAREVATDWWKARQADDGDASALHGPDAVPWRRAWALGALERSSPERVWPDVRLASLTGRGRRDRPSGHRPGGQTRRPRRP